ncbi:MAG: SMC family ATPase, partial [Catalinimonas sp.]
MIPVHLTLEGIYSYREPQKIDFAALTDARLFGIFGAVGSGKSTILEAIMFVLYHQSDRLSQRDNRYYNMMNLQSDEMKIDFIFRCGPRNEEKYRFFFRARRNRNCFDDVSVRERTFYRWDADEGWEPLDSVEDATPLIGMSYRNFMQTIIIPQGKFRDFIDQTSSGRSRMLKELFSLHRFDLHANTNHLLAETRQIIGRLEGQLAEIGEVREEELLTHQHRAGELRDEVVEKEMHLRRLDERGRRLEELRGLFERIATAEAKEQVLAERETDHAARTEKLRRYERALTFFDTKMKSRRRLHDARTRQQEQLAALTERRAQLAKDLETAQGRLAAARAAHDARDRRREIIEDLDHLLVLAALRVEQARVSAAEAHRQQEHAAREARRSTAKARLVELEKALDAGAQRADDETECREALLWHREARRYRDDHRRRQEEHRQMAERRQAPLSELRERLNQSKAFAGLEAFADYHAKNEEVTRDVDAKIADLRAEHQQLLVRRKLAQYADELR